MQSGIKAYAASVAKDQTWDLLQRALKSIEYRRDPPPRGRFQLVREDEANYAVLYIFTFNPNTYRPDEMRHTRHEFVVPLTTYNERQWSRWVLERILSIEMHETVENFFVRVDGKCAPECECELCGHLCSDHDGRESSCRADGCANHRFRCADGHYERLHSPYHGNGWDPYSIWFEGDPEERAKSPGED